MRGRARARPARHRVQRASPRAPSTVRAHRGAAAAPCRAPLHACPAVLTSNAAAPRPHSFPTPPSPCAPPCCTCTFPAAASSFTLAPHSPDALVLYPALRPLPRLDARLATSADAGPRTLGCLLLYIMVRQAGAQHACLRKQEMHAAGDACLCRGAMPSCRRVAEQVAAADHWCSVRWRVQAPLEKSPLPVRGSSSPRRAADTGGCVQQEPAFRSAERGLLFALASSAVAS